MAGYCIHCGNPLEEDSKFCVACGKPVGSAAGEKNDIPENTDEKEKIVRQEDGGAPKATAVRKDAEPGKKQGIFGLLASEFLELLKHPKKLIPTFVLTAVWIVLPIVMGFSAGANIPIVRFISTLTYANGGVLGGFFGAVGGIFGKAVFAAAVNGIVLSICEKKNPFGGLKKNALSVLGGGARAVSPFLIGGGIGFILYFFFNITSAPQNSMISIVCVISLVRTVAMQNGIAFTLAFWTVKKLSKGKAPTRAFLNRIFSGLAAAFAVSFPVTFLRVRFLTPLLGGILLAVGIALPFIFSAVEKKTAQKSRA